MLKNCAQGFSLIELIVVITLVAIIASFSTTMNLSSLSQSNVTKERDLFVTLLLQRTRSAALANIGETSHGVQIENDMHRYVFFDGSTYDANAPSNREIPYSNETMTVTNSGGDTILFEQLSGNVTTGAGTISISNTEATQKIIIRENGQIDW